MNWFYHPVYPVHLVRFMKKFDRFDDHACEKLLDFFILVPQAQVVLDEIRKSHQKGDIFRVKSAFPGIRS